MICITDLLLKIFLGKEGASGKKSRTKYGNFASWTGIICNVMLCILKGIAGLLSGSVAIIADAANNLSDAGSSLISLIGFKVSDKPADKEHPYGHARFEYISCLAVAFVIMGISLTLLRSSAEKIFNPGAFEGSILSIVILAISILVKLWMGLFYRKMGKMIDSSVLLANSKDSFNDAISTFAVLISIILYTLTKINLDGYLGVLVAFFIMYTGFSALKETFDNILGKVPDKGLVESIVKKLESYDGVWGIHDLMVHSYGPEKYFASVHVEVPSDVDILISHDMIDNIEREFKNEMNIDMVIHLDPIVTDDEEVNSLKEATVKIVSEINPEYGVHDFRMVRGETHSNLIFDVGIPVGEKISESELKGAIEAKIKEIDEKYFCVITVDRNVV